MDNLHSSFSHKVVRKWYKTPISKAALIYPIFISDEANVEQEIDSMPGQKIFGINKIISFLSPLINNLGLEAIILFGSPSARFLKDEIGSQGHSILVPAIELINKTFPNLLIICDLCLCAYTTHGHCGIFNSNGPDHNYAPDSIETGKRLAEIAVLYAKAGANIIAPSDMMDGRIKAIKDALFMHGYGNRVGVMSYSAKFASCFYGPFRGAANSKPIGDRKCYQLPPFSRGLAQRAILRDVSEGADMIMIKPSYPYLDVVRDAKNIAPNHLIAVYQVSGEYVMLLGCKENFKEAVLESLEGCLRAGADVIITYFAPQVLQWIVDDIY
jgi:porphobilinogen synthase